MTDFISVLVPLYNEEESLEELHEKLTKNLILIADQNYEIIYANDGSKDNSFEILEKLKERDSHVRVLNFSRNNGKAAAISIGFAKAKGDWLFTIDADLQDDPDEMPSLLKIAKEQKLDLLSGWKKKRHDPLEKRIPSKFFNFFTSLVGGIRLHDFNCGFKLYRKKVIKSVFPLIYGEMHRFIPLLAHWNGFSVGEAPVNHHARKFGSSKYGFSRYIHGFLDLITLTFLNRFRSRPMHIFGLFGALLFFAGLGIDIYFLVDWIKKGEAHIRPMMLLGIALNIISLQFFSIGLLSELIIQRSNKTTDYSYEEL